MKAKQMGSLCIRMAAVIFTATLIAACAESIDGVRGPYLQNPSSTSMIIKWRDEETNLARVTYGTSPQGLFETVEIKSDAFDHEVSLENLAPDTLYYYRVNGANQGVFTFKTPPVEGDAMPTRVWILGDSGTADSNAREVRQAFYKFNQGSATDMMIMLGDNAYKNGTDRDYQRAFFNVYASSLYRTPVWSTIGNHDARSDGGSTYFDIFTLPSDGKTGGVPSGTEAYYSFNYSNIHFVSLDSEVSDRSSAGAMYSWLMTDLAANTQDWTVVFFHQPPYSKGTYDSDGSNSAMSDMRENFTAIFDLFGVDLVFTGHSHNYERSYPILGHRGKSATFLQSMKTDPGNGRKDDDGAYRKRFNSNDYGVIYTVAGSSGKTRSAPLNHPVHYVSMNQLGSVVLDFNDDVVDVTFVSPNPRAIDYYTVEKSLDI